MDSFEDFLVSKNSELIKKQPKPVSFTYSKYQLQEIINDYINEYNKKPAGLPSSEEYGSWNGFTSYSDIDIVRMVEKFNKLPNKNDYKEISSITQTIDMMEPESRNLPAPFMITINELRQHKEYLEYLELLKEQDKNQKDRLEQEQKLRTEQVLLRQKEDQSEKKQLERNEYIKRQLEVIRDKFEIIKTDKEVYEPVKVDLLKERTYFYHVKNNASPSDITKIDEYIKKLSLLEQEVINKKQIEEVKANDDEKEKLKEELSKLNNQIAEMIAYMRPYMQVSKVNEEMTKVINKNNELDSLQIVDSITDYKRMIETKKELVVFLEKATDFIKTRVEQAKVTEKPVIEEPKPLPNDFWNEFDKPIEKEKTGPLPADFWKEFDSPESLTRPEKMFNQDGTYTYEYMTYLATTPIGFNKDIYDQLEKYNETVKKQKTEGIEITPIEEKQSSGGMHM